jgi:hypothetical protein
MVAFFGGGCDMLAKELPLAKGDRGLCRLLRCGTLRRN